MTKLKVIDRETWNNRIVHFPEANFLQSWQYGETQIEVGHQVLRYEITDDNKSVGLVQVAIKNAKRGRFMEIAGGPLIDWGNLSLVSDTIAALKGLGREQNCVFVRFRAQCPDTEDLREVLQKLGCKLSPMHVTADHTSIIDLRPSLDQLLTNMRQQTRYEINRSARRGITVETAKDASFIDEFYQIQSETARRQGFIPPSKRYLNALYENFGEHIKLYRASKDSALLNLAIVVNFGHEAAYLEAASTEDARREPGSYAIIWQAIRDAKSENLERFNLWGIAPPNSPNHRYAGVTTFKHGFGGNDMAYLPPHDIVIKPLHYQLNHLVEIIRKKRRHL